MKSSDAKYGGRSANPLAALEKRQYVTSKALVRGLKESLDAIKGKIATAKTPAFAESQRKLFAEISASYAEIAKSADKYLKDEVSAAAKLGGKAAGIDAGGQDLVRWDEARCRRYWMYVNPQAGKNLAAVFTDKMAESTVTALRRSVVEVQRRAAIEGMSLKDQHKAILESWNALTGDDSNFQFIDRSGKAWDNARYLQMLSRTTAQRVYRDAYADRLAESGFKLVRITSLGAADCPVCRAWQGVICTIAGTQGNLPTIDQAREAGVWHPNCMCSMEYVDEELDADDIEAQEKTDAVDWEDGDAVQERTDGMAIGRFKAQGMDDAEAEDALTRAKIEEALRTELFLENSGDIANGFSHEQLDGFRKNGLPDFALTKGKQKPGIDGGTIYIDRAHPEESLHDLLGVKAVRVEAPQEPPEAPRFAPDLSALEHAKVKVAEALQRAKSALADIGATPVGADSIDTLKAEWSSLVDFTAEVAAADKAKGLIDKAKTDAGAAVAAIDPADLDSIARPTDEASQKAFDTKCAAAIAAAEGRAKDAADAKKSFADAKHDADVAVSAAKTKIEAFKTSTVAAATSEADGATQDATDLHDLSKAARNEIGKLKKSAGLIKGY